MAYLTTNFFEGGTADEYRVVLGVAHRDGALPDGQMYHFAGPTPGGWLVVAVWDSKKSYDHFMSTTLMPALSQVTGGFSAIPQRRDVDNVDMASATIGQHER